MKNSVVRYRVPRYLGLNSIKKMEGDCYQLEFGYSKQLHKKTCCQSGGTENELEEAMSWEA